MHTGAAGPWCRWILRVQLPKQVVILRDREEIEDFWRESKDLRTDFIAKVIKVRRSPDSRKKDFAFFDPSG